MKKRLYRVRKDKTRIYRDALYRSEDRKIQVLIRRDCEGFDSLPDSMLFERDIPDERIDQEYPSESDCSWMDTLEDERSWAAISPESRRWFEDLKRGFGA